MADFIAFFDSDDYWTKNKLKDQMSFMTQNNHNFTFSDLTPVNVSAKVSFSARNV